MKILYTILIVCTTVLQAQENSRFAPPASNEKIRNVIFFIGDGMGLGHIASTSRKYLGRGQYLAIQKMPVTGIITTYPAEADITDSAAGATALSTGYKTRNAMVGVTPDSLPHATIMETAIQAKIKTGLVVTSAITDATPAAFAAHVPARKQQTLIAEQMLQSHVNVLLGGGANYFLPSGAGGERTDGRDLFKEAEGVGYQVVHDSLGLVRVTTGNVLGIFDKTGLPHVPTPSLRTMTEKALDLLQENTQGFFLMVEGSQIDWGGHANNFDYMAQQLIQFDAAVSVGEAFAKSHGETLVIVTADHETGGITLTSSDPRGDSTDVSWSTDGHTSTPVPVFAFGPGALRFTGYMDNTDIPKIIAALLKFNYPFDKN